jgi:hypothetical protein
MTADADPQMTAVTRDDGGGPQVTRGASRMPGGAARPMVAAALLGAACVAWSAYPVQPTGAAGTAILTVAAACLAAGTARLATLGLATPEGTRSFEALPVQLWHATVDALRRLPWAEGAVVGALALEALHRSRPWHTALLGAALLGYLLATHLAESAAAAGVLRRQLPVLAAGLGLLVLATGAALLPSAGAGLTADWLRVLAAAAAITVAALALPV